MLSTSAERRSERGAIEGHATMTHPIASAVSDVVEGFGRWHLWVHMGWAEVRRRYRRTVLGPFWATLSVAIFIFGFGVVGAALWHTPIGKYLPFLCTGYLAWVLFSTLVIES